MQKTVQEAQAEYIERQARLDQIRKDWTRKQAIYSGWLETHKAKMIAEGLWDVDTGARNNLPA